MSCVLLVACSHQYIEPATNAQQQSVFEEKTRHGSKVFSIHDYDNNGSLSKQEYQQLLQQIKARRESSDRPKGRYSRPLNFEEVDKNQDGRITEDEMITALNLRLQQHRRYRYRGGRE